MISRTIGSPARSRPFQASQSLLILRQVRLTTSLPTVPPSYLYKIDKKGRAHPRSDGNDLTDFHRFVCDDDAVDEQFQQLPFRAKSASSGPDEGVGRTLGMSRKACDFGRTIGDVGELAFLAIERGEPKP